MNISIRNFKAFQGLLEINLGDKNLLVYGDNGSGKSSLFEAFKIIFFREKMLSQNVRIAATREEQNQLNQEYWEKFNNKINDVDFEILVDGNDFNDFDISRYQVSMISINDLAFSNEISLSALLSTMYLPIDPDVFLQANYEYIQEEVNDSLSVFFEGIEVNIDRQDDYYLRIKDSVRNIESKRELNVYFNEAKLNLILLLVYFNVIFYSEKKGTNKVLVLDDYITSLDVSNRSFLIKYIFEKFSGYQLVIFTHNVNVYNLKYFFNKGILNTNESWVYANLYEFNMECKMYVKNTITSVSEIRTEYVTKPGDVEKIGNMIRQKFEILLYEYSKLLSIGAVEDSKHIIARILADKSLYYEQNKGANDLVDDIYKMTTNGTYFNLRERIIKKIDRYRKDDFDNLKKIILDMKLFKRITLHPMSHGSLGQTTFTIKEIEISLDLLEKFEKYYINLIDSDVSSI